VTKTEIFKGGLPYKPDVKRLNEEFPVDQLIEGCVITHEQFEAILQQEHGTGRYYAVINSWIIHQRSENGIYIAWDPGTGVKVLNPAEILNHAETRTRQKLRQTGRAIKTFAWVNRARLDEIGQKRLDHQLRVASLIKESIESARKQMAVELAPVKSLPKPAHQSH
jgi:hypothetical protein